MPEPMTLREIHQLGRRHGEDLALSVLYEGDPQDREVFYDSLATAEEHFGQHSPFEAHAAAINARELDGEGQADRGWEVYEAAFARGVRVALRQAGRRDLL